MIDPICGCQSKFQADPARWTEGIQTFIPLFMILGVITAFPAARYVLDPGAGWHSAMLDFMAAFFIVFAGFKLLDVKGFADAYGTYDLIAKKSRAYALAYPFLELALGLSYLLRWQLHVVNWVTWIVMTIGGIGVAKALLKKQKIQCACLGTKIRLPMTKITLIEDVTMALMALGMLIKF